MILKRGARYRTALFGFGRAGASYADDSRTAKHYRYTAHAQVLLDHPAFDWQAVVDPQPAALRIATERWKVPVTAATAEEVAKRVSPEIVVLATPPEARAAIVKALPGLRAAIVEKPLGRNAAEAKAFVALCAERHVTVQVNFWRRADTTFRRLASGELARRIGSIQAAAGWYGNGIRNNGVHVVDFLRMLCGEVRFAAVLGPSALADGSSVPDDVQFPAGLWFASGLFAVLQALDFAAYREVGIDLWGRKGRLTVLQEGLWIAASPRISNRAVSDAFEIASDRPEQIPATAGEALWHLYDDLIQALETGRAPCSSALSALATERIVDALVGSAGRGEIACRIAFSDA